MTGGWIDPGLAAEFPELALWHVELDVPVERSSPPGVRQRLKALSSRVNGAQATVLRSKPIPHAYRVFFRHIGLDPDVDRVPIEALILRRLKAGAFLPESAVEDAVTIAVAETAVGIWALDADTCGPSFGIRPAVERERLGRRDERAPWLPGGRLCVVDDEGPVAILFGEVAPGHGVTRATRRAHLLAVQVAGVPSIHVSEALWTVEDLLAAGD